MYLRNVSSHGQASYEKEKNTLHARPQKVLSSPSSQETARMTKNRQMNKTRAIKKNIIAAHAGATKIDAAHIKKTGKELDRGSQAVVFEGLGYCQGCP